MNENLTELKNNQSNPIDMIEDIIFQENWTHERISLQELIICIRGQWGEYHANIIWDQDSDILQTSIGFNLGIPQQQFSKYINSELKNLIFKVNEQMQIGHFEIWHEEHMIVWRSGQVLSKKNKHEPSDFERLIELALNDCNRFYPAFQYVLWGNTTAEDAFKIALFDTIGSA
jgi:hypothetical protein